MDIRLHFRVTFPFEKSHYKTFFVHTCTSREDKRIAVRRMKSETGGRDVPAKPGGRAGQRQQCRLEGERGRMVTHSID